MKHYLFTIYDSKVNRLYGGSKQKAKIYRVKNNQPQYIGVAEWNTASYRGAMSEVFNQLIRLGEIPKKYYNSSVCEWRGAGYFAGDVTGKYSITEI